MLNYYNNVFYMNTDIKKNEKEHYIEGKVKDLSQCLKFDLAMLYVNYANNTIDYEELEYTQDNYMQIINDLENLENQDKIIKVCENESMQSLYFESEVK